LSARTNRPSEPPPDLRTERERFVRTYLHKGVELTETLMRENQGLEQEVQRLRDENTRLRAQLASNDAIRELLVSIEGLTRERDALLHRSDEMEREFVEHAERQSEIELELNNLASLYVASFQLNATLSVTDVVRHMSELLEQLIGAQTFTIYALSQDGSRALPLGARGHAGGALPAPLSVEDGMLGDACLTGVARIIEPNQARAPNQPLAVLPLVYASQVVGVISVHKLLPHKQEWVRVDQELFKLLAVHGATALIAANLFATDPSPRAALRDVLAHMENERARLLTAAGADFGSDL
jgi:hypothetical protein